MSTSTLGRRFVDFAHAQGEFTAVFTEAVKGCIADADCCLQRDGKRGQADNVAKTGQAAVK